MQDDQWPIGLVLGSEGLFDDQPQALEEIGAESGLSAISLGRVGNDGPASSTGRIDSPSNVLFDGHGKA